MKVTTTSSAIRVAFTPTELRDLYWLAEDARMRGVPVSDRVSALIAELDRARHTVQAAQASKRIAKQRERDAERQLRERHHSGMLDDFVFLADRADYADASSDPDYRAWVDLALQEILSKPLPDQCEIRRDVWKVRVTRHRPGEEFEIVGVDCTETSDRAEVENVARRLIERHVAVTA